MPSPPEGRSGEEGREAGAGFETGRRCPEIPAGTEGNRSRPRGT